MEKLRITVKKEDIRLGWPLNENMCPVARGARRAGCARVSVTEEKLTVGRYGHGQKIYNLPLKASRFIRRFDEGKLVKPFKFVATQITD